VLQAITEEQQRRKDINVVINDKIRGMGTITSVKNYLTKLYNKVDTSIHGKFLTEVGLKIQRNGDVVSEIFTNIKDEENKTALIEKLQNFYKENPYPPNDSTNEEFYKGGRKTRKHHNKKTKRRNKRNNRRTSRK